jgi:hypothetical protein
MRLGGRAPLSVASSESRENGRKASAGGTEQVGVQLSGIKVINMPIIDWQER